MTAVLRLLPGRDRMAAVQVWPKAAPIPAGTVEEAREHLFELTGAEGADTAELLIDDQPLEALRTTDRRTALWRWSPGFHAGTAEARLRLGGRSWEFEVVTDPSRRKLTRDDFDTMVREILEDTFALFSLTSFRTGVARGAGTRPPPIARLEFLRSRMAELERVVAAIDASPRRLLKAEDALLPYHRATRATGAEILRSFRSGRLLRETDGARLPPALQGHLPERIRRQVRRSSLDLREHREMKACLRTWAQWLTRAADTLAAAAPDGGEGRSAWRLWSGRARRLARRLDMLLALPLFAEVGDAPPRPVSSPVWRGDPRYGAFLRLHRDMSLGIAGVFGDFLQLPLARTFELYELWAFLRLLRAAVERHGADAPDLADLFRAGPGGVTIASEAVRVPIRSAGIALCFQRRYREFWVERDGRGSFSRHMQPDIAVEDIEGAREPRRLVVLDAKYRIGEDLNDAIGSAHIYRDAIVSPLAEGGVASVVTGAYLLTPDSPDHDADWKATRMPGRLFHPAYRAEFRFGAVTLRPGMSIAEVGVVLDAVLADTAC